MVTHNSSSYSARRCHTKHAWLQDNRHEQRQLQAIHGSTHMILQHNNAALGIILILA